MQVTFDHGANEYVVLLTPMEAHRMVWGGLAATVRAEREALRQALVNVEDGLPDAWYREHVNLPMDRETAERLGVPTEG